MIVNQHAARACSLASVQVWSGKWVHGFDSVGRLVARYSGTIEDVGDRVRKLVAGRVGIDYLAGRQGDGYTVVAEDFEDAIKRSKEMTHE